MTVTLTTKTQGARRTDVRLHHVPGAQVPANRERGCLPRIRIRGAAPTVPALLPQQLCGHQQNAPVLPREGLPHGGEGAAQLPPQRPVQVWVGVLLQVRGGGA